VNAVLDRALEVIRARRAAARARGIELVGVVGSVARGEARDDSDVDIAYTCIGRPTLFDIGGVLMDVKEDIGRDVDLVDIDNARPRVRAELERDLVRA
jgi:predicted nucleotidyltransferase